MKVFNRRATHDYQIYDKFEAGIVLSGAEVKSVRDGHLQLEDSFVRVKDGEAWLENAHIHPYSFADSREYNPRQARKLLLHRKELLKLQLQAQQGMSIIALSCYNKGRNIKLEIALARGKKKYEKREDLKKRDAAREVETALRGKI
jgi:SsrA-binding protein